MNATEYIIQQIPLSQAATEYAERYCMFYDNAEFSVGPETVTITHCVTIDPTQSVFWPGNGIS